MSEVIDYTAFRQRRIDADRARLPPAVQEVVRRHAAYMDEMRSIGLEMHREQEQRVKAFLETMYEKHE